MATAHYFNKKTDIPLQLGLVAAAIKKEKFEFYSSPPVFSWRKIDKGTIALANGMQISNNDKTLLDLGCGYGVVGIVAAHFFPDLKVVMSDASERAVFLAKKNIEKYGLQDSVKVVCGNLYELFETQDAERATHYEKFDIIASNPPYSAGKTIVTELISKAPLHLTPKGSLQIVGRHTKGGRMYKDEMLKVFKTVEETGKAGGYRVYIGRN